MEKIMKRNVILAGAMMLSTVAGAFEWNFPRGKDPALRIANGAAFDFPQGFKATLRFSADLGRVSRKTRFANLFTHGRDFNDGYSVMIRNDGHLLFYVLGMVPQYYVHSAVLESNREYLLEMYLTPSALRVFIDGAETGSLPIATPLKHAGRGAPLQIGSMGGYRFSGTIASLTLEDISGVKLPLGGPKPRPAAAPKVQARAEIEWVRPICVEKDRYIGWPSVARLQSGDIVAVFSGDRDAHVCPYGKVQMVRSTDGGRTWTPMAKTPMFGLPPHVIELADGKLVCVYGRRFADPGYGEFACISDDGGLTWDGANEISLSPSFCDDLGYPATCVLPSGDLLTVYYQRRTPDERPCLMATKWRVTR